ncbi:transposable element tcb2 transposase [Trichonephila clavipes]|nr:transposable element tcb2 transposase [Trichonephila clavipes]
MQRAVQKRSRPPLTPNDLWIALQGSWCQLPPALLQTLIESMPSRVAALLRARWGSTRLVYVLNEDHRDWSSEFCEWYLNINSND